MSQKTVCIVGAGPSGLVAAKTLLHDRRACDRFRVTVFEAQPRVGGLWPSSPADRDGLVHPQMLANQSRNTVQFSDLAWEDGVPEFPRAWQVGHYLQQYHDRYLKTDSVRMQLGWRVVRAEPGGRTSGRGWHVRAEKVGGGETLEESFDYLVVASGFFGEPEMPAGLRVADATVPVVHSSQYRDLPLLLAQRDKPPPPEARKILVVGGQFSGVEIAGTIANHLSASAHAPGPSSLAEAETYSVHHLIQRPSWVFPLFTSPTPSSPTPPFLPFDLNSYNLRKRPRPLVNTQGHIDVATARKVHGLFQAALGTDQSEYGPALAMRGDDILDNPPYIGVSDTYLEHVREGRIVVSKGRLATVSGEGAVVKGDNGQETTLQAAAVILATGFSPAASLSFFPDTVKAALAFDPASLRHPVALAFHGSCHPDVPDLAFVGYYRSPYWGIMEMQARLAAALFATDADADSSGSWYPASFPAWPALGAALAADQSIEWTLSLRNDPRASQFPMGDYLFLMDAFSQALGCPLADSKAAADEPEVVTPARYADDENGADVALSLRHTTAVVQAGLTQARFVARAVFRSLQGRWHLERDLVSALPSHPSGRFVGTAEFRLRNGTSDGEEQQDLSEDSEYLYVEDGTFTATSGLSFRATRRYVWRYHAPTDQLSVWFVRTDDNKRADYLFHKLAWSPGPAGWRATAGHLCIDDFYDVAYDFVFAGVHLHDWRLRYTVRGPKKDYTIDGRYTR